MSAECFDSRDRSDRKPSNEGETTFAFLDRVERAYFARCRDVINAWVAAYPQEHRHELIQRLRAGTSARQEQAFWELYLHQVMTRAGWNMSVHPPVPGSTRVPDFLASESEASFYLEATSSGLSADQEADDRRLDVIMRELGKVQTTDFSLWVTCEQSGDRSPSVGQLRATLESWLASLSADEVIAQYSAQKGHRFRGLPKLPWEHDEWRFSFTAYPRSLEARGAKDFPSVGAHGRGEVPVVDNVAPLQKAFKAKATRYGRKPDLPLLIAYLDLGSFSAAYPTYVNALFGPVVGGSPNGVWFAGDRPHYRGVSAVITVWNLKPWGAVKNSPVVIHNPWAERPLTCELPWPEVSVDPDHGATSLREPTRGLAELLGLPEDWPGDPNLRFTD